ncbi:type IV pilin protein [Bdellovibrio sp. HCB337]|uniref:type IV pilin protein n=1 Tax=Bdellovibrio sp. HCB337 TaxID=3394358 RepID=UPI0039A5D4AB
MNVTSRKSQAGFSLVELMVVVAIIGILASLAIPSIGKYMAKARQSEAKTQLSSLYTAEKAFYAEYTIYDNRFGAVGYSPEGLLRYNVGFTGGTVALPANGYNNTLVGSQLLTNTLAFCDPGGVVVLANQRNCAILNGATAAPPPPLPASLTAATTFTASATAVIHSIGTTDTWTMDQVKVMRNTVSGIP